jgi:hypothetical protein
MAIHSDSDPLPSPEPFRNMVPIPDPTTLTNQLVAQATSALREILEARLDASDKAVAELTRMTETRVAAAVTQVKELYAEKFRLVESAIETNRDAIVNRFDLLDKQMIKAATDVKSAEDERFRAIAERFEVLEKQMIKAATDVKSAEDERFRSISDRFEVLDKQMIKAAADVKSAEDERFRAIADRFEVLDKQTIKAAADVKSAVDAAFAAAASGVSQQNQANFLASQKQEAAFTKQIDQLADNVRQISKGIGDQINDLKKTNDDKFGDLKDRIVAMEGRSSVSDPNTAGALHDMANAISTLKQSRDEGSGGRQQKADSTAWIFGAIAAAVAIGMMTLEMFRAAH